MTSIRSLLIASTLALYAPAQGLVIEDIIDQERAPKAAQAVVKEGPAPLPIRITGRIVDDLGAPLVGAAVSVVPGGDYTSRAVEQQPDARSGANGRFEILFSPPAQAALGKARLHVLMRGHAAIHVAFQSVIEQPQEEQARDDGPAVPGEPGRQEPATGQRATADLGDLVLSPGAALFGRVRDPTGKALGGVRVVGEDSLDNNRFLRSNDGRPHHECAAVTDAAGIFRLPGSYDRAVDLSFTKDGYYEHNAHCIDRQAPLEIEMAASGWVQGRILGPSGSPLATGYTVKFELRVDSLSGTSSADGSFRFSLPVTGRYRIDAQPVPGQPVKATSTPLLKGPVAALELVLESAEESATVATNTAAAPTSRPWPAGQGEEGTATARPSGVLVRAVDKVTGKPIAKFRSVTLWDNSSGTNLVNRDYRLANALHGQAVDADEQGIALLPGPSRNNVRVGTLAVQAEGMARKVIGEVEWPDDAEEGATIHVEVTVELEAESRITGKITDPDSGAPVTGVQVRCKPDRGVQAQFFGRYNHPEAAKTGADGAFTLGNLAAGDYVLEFKHEKRPTPEPVQVSLEPGQHLADLVVSMTRGATLRGVLIGAVVGRQWHVRLQALPDFINGAWNYRGVTYYSTNQGMPKDAVAIGPDGSFTIEGIAPGHYLLELLRRSPPRCGQFIRFATEAMTIEKDLEKTFDMAKQRLGRVSGRIIQKGAPVPTARLVVIAKYVRQGVYYGGTNLVGTRTFVEPDGSFDLEVPPGRHEIMVADLATSIPLIEGQDFRVKAGGHTVRDLELRARVLDVTLVPIGEGGAVLANRLEVRVASAQRKMVMPGLVVGGNPQYDQGRGLALMPGTTRVQVFVPQGDVYLFVRSSVSNLMPSKNRRQVQPLGEAQLEVKDSDPPVLQVEIVVGQPAGLEGADERKEDATDPDGGREEPGR